MCCVAPVLWCCLQACSGAGKNEEAVKGMEQLCGVKAEAAGLSMMNSVQAAGVSLEARLQVSHCRSSDHLVSYGLKESIHLRPCQEAFSIGYEGVSMGQIAQGGQWLSQTSVPVEQWVSGASRK